MRYFTATVAPCSSSFFFISSASAFVTFSFTGFGAPSTRSLASLRPSPVSSRTTLMTWIFFSPAALRMTSNSVFSSAAAAAAPPPAAPATAATAIGAAADTPHFSCSSFESWAASSSVSLSSCSAICSTVIVVSPLSFRYALAAGCFRFVGGRGAALLQDVGELALRRRQHADQLGQDALDRADQLRADRFPRRQVGERLEPGRREHLSLDVPGLHRERLVGPGERVQGLGDGDRILFRDDHARRALEVRLEP